MRHNSYRIVLFSFFLIAFSASASAAQACLNYRAFGQVCVGDRVAVDGYSGRAVALNYRMRQVGIRFDSSAQGNYDLERVSVGRGCLGDACVGDRAVVHSYEGYVIGINPDRGQTTIRFNSGSAGTYDLNRVAVGKGCMDEFCVGARAMVHGYSGAIIGVNRIVDQVAIRFDSGSIGTYDSRLVAVGAY